MRNPTRNDLYKNWPLISDDPTETRNRPTANSIPCHSGALKSLVKLMRRLEFCFVLHYVSQRLFESVITSKAVAMQKPINPMLISGLQQNRTVHRMF